MQWPLILVGLVGYLGIFVLCALGERDILNAKRMRTISILKYVCVVLWLGASILLSVFYM